MPDSLSICPTGQQPFRPSHRRTVAWRGDLARAAAAIAVTASA
jgi:hypothetical protein